MSVKSVPIAAFLLDMHYDDWMHMRPYEWSYHMWYPGWLAILLSSVFFAALAAVVVALWPRRMEMIATLAIERPGWSVIYGLVAALAVVPIAVFLALTIIGVLLIPLEILFFIILWVAGRIGIGLAIGRAVLGGANRPVNMPLAAALGTLLLGLIRLVPFVGPILAGVLELIGLGSVLITWFGTRPDWMAENIRRFPDTYRRNPPPQPPPPKSGQEYLGTNI
ncbi:MAG: hypothetical protein ABFD54_04035 [Armatimonadota bacterium]|nr:hypothetical protein [bacterium]